MAIRISLDVSKVFYSRRNTFFQVRPRVTWTRSNLFLSRQKCHVSSQTNPVFLAQKSGYAVEFFCWSDLAEVAA